MLLLSAKRISNATKVYISYLLSKYLKKYFTPGMPVAFALEPTTACNLRCPECPSGLRNFTRPTGNMQPETFKKAVDALAPTALHLTLYFQGEPYIHPQFTDMLRYAQEKKLYVTTSTNAHFLNSENARKTVESGLHRLIISIDGMTQETYSQYRKEGHLEKVLEGTKHILYWKKKLNRFYPLVCFQFLVVKPNEHELTALKKLAAELGVDKVLLKTAQLYDYENGHELMPENPKWSRYRKLPNGKYALKNSLPNHCWRLWHSCVITWDGQALPCCFDKDATFAMGNILQTPFRDIWKSRTYEDFRKQLLTGRKHISICRNCSEGTKVWADE